MKTEPTKTFSIRIPASLYDKMADVADDNDRTLSQEGRRALQSHVQKHKQKKNLAAGGFQR